MSALSVSKRFGRKSNRNSRGAAHDSSDDVGEGSQTVQTSATKEDLALGVAQSVSSPAEASSSSTDQSPAKKKKHRHLPSIKVSPAKRLFKDGHAKTTESPDGAKRNKHRKSLSRKLASKSVHLAGKLLRRHKRIGYSASFAAVSSSVSSVLKHKKTSSATTPTTKETPKELQGAVAPQPPEPEKPRSIPSHHTSEETSHSVTFDIPEDQKDTKMADVELGGSRNIATSVAVAHATGGSPVGAVKDAFTPGEKSDGLVTKVHTHALDTVALAGAGTSIATMALTKGGTAKAASALTVAFSPYAAYQKRRCNKIGTLRDQHNRLRSNVNEMMQENEKLKANVDRLETSVSDLEDVENDLSKLANTSNLDRLVEVVKEHKRVTANIKQALKADVMFQVMEVLMQSDRNRDFIIGPKEINMMVMRMKMVSGVNFNEKNFRAKVAAEGHMSLTSIMELFRDLEDDDINEEEAIFTPNLDSLKK